MLRRFLYAVLVPSLAIGICSCGRLKASLVGAGTTSAYYEVKSSTINGTLELHNFSFAKLAIVRNADKTPRVAAVEIMATLGTEEAFSALLLYTSEGFDDFSRSILAREFIQSLPTTDAGQWVKTVQFMRVLPSPDGSTTFISVDKPEPLKKKPKLPKFSSFFCGNVNLDSVGATCRRTLCDLATCIDKFLESVLDNAVFIDPSKPRQIECDTDVQKVKCICPPGCG
jgi:hypothetical protein